MDACQALLVLDSANMGKLTLEQGQRQLRLCSVCKAGASRART